MQFTSGIFLMIFLPITVGLYYLGRGYKYKNRILLLASLVFYAWGEPLFVFVLIISIVVNYIGGIIIGRKSKKRIFLILNLIFNLGILFVFKYLSFVTVEISKLIPINVISITLPIGISFYTFQIISYILDVYYGRVKAQKNIFDLALYVCMFPQLVAGPIVRYSDVEIEISCRTENLESFCQGTHRFAIGLAKKVLIADFLGGIADKIFIISENSILPLITAWIGALAYTFEIYYDFSGYSDMAIGLGMCFGFHFKENFNYPYISCSISEFWKRWHMSLTDWFRDYVYIPLGGNRVSTKRHIFNLFVVWLLTGIWHGAEWTFILWGLMYFAIQLFEKKTMIMEKIPKVVGYFITMAIVAFGWTLFKASNLHNASRYIFAMLGRGNSLVDRDTILYIKSAAVVLIISYVGSFPIVRILKNRIRNYSIKRICYCLKIPISAILFGVCLLIIINGSYSPFIYFNF